MSRRVRSRTACAVAGLSLALVAGCGSGSPSTNNGPRAQQSPRPAATASATPVTADVRACVGVEAVISHITVDTARWSPTHDPFDQNVAARLSTQASSLGAEGPLADDTRIKLAISATASSFSGVAIAMRSGHRARVARAIDRSRVAYKRLKAACSLDQGD